MSRASIEDGAAVPEYELEQYFPQRRELSPEEKEKLRDQHGYLRTYFMSNPGDFRNIQRWLNQARFGVTYDVYLARSARYALVAAGIGLLAALLATVQLAGSGAFDSLASILGVNADPAFVYGIGFVVVVLSVAVTGGGTWLGRYYYPRSVTNGRRRAIDIQLPHAIVYMYALSHGGMNTLEVIRELSRAEGVYGEVSNEFDMILRDVELFGNDLFTALRDARNITPSDNLEQFLDDMLSVLDSGSDFAGFLEGEAATYMEEARQEQDDFLDTLSVLSEVFVVMFVAAPLFLIVTLLVISLLGGSSLVQTYLLVYLGLPLGMLAFLVTVDVLSQPYAQNSGQVELEEQEEEEEEAPASVQEHELFAEYEERKRRDDFRQLVKNPISLFKRANPLLSLAITVPSSLLIVGVLISTGTLAASYEGFTSTPIRTTIGLAVLPFLVVSLPLTLLYESQRRRERRISRRFPDTLNILSSANKMGIPLTDALDLVSRWSEGVLSEELRKVRNDIEWNHDIEAALLKFANRLGVPQVTRTMNLIAKGSRSSSDLSNIISIAAEDTRNRYQIERKRESEMRAYTAIVVIGFLVYLAVIVLVDTSYLGPVGEMTQQAVEEGNADLLNVSAVPVQAYRTVFFHSALIQGVGSGLLAGKLAENDVLAGLKYSIVLVVITLVIFLFI